MSCSKIILNLNGKRKVYNALEFIYYLVKHIVDHPDDIEIKEQEGKQVEIYELRVNKADFGKVLGKKGKNIDAIRLLLRAYSAKYGKRVILEIIE